MPPRTLIQCVAVPESSQGDPETLRSDVSRARGAAADPPPSGAIAGSGIHLLSLRATPAHVQRRCKLLELFPRRDLVVCLTKALAGLARRVAWHDVNVVMRHRLAGMNAGILEYVYACGAELVDEQAGHPAGLELDGEELLDRGVDQGSRMFIRDHQERSALVLPRIQQDGHSGSACDEHPIGATAQVGAERAR